MRCPQLRAGDGPLFGGSHGGIGERVRLAAMTDEELMEVIVHSPEAAALVNGGVKTQDCKQASKFDQDSGSTGAEG